MRWLDGSHTAESLGVERLSQLRAMQVACACVFGAAALYTGFFISIAHWTAAAASATSMVVAPLVVYLARQGRLTFAAHLLVTCITASVGAAIAVGGGLQHPVVAWLVMIPICASLVLGSRGALQWSVWTTLLIVCFWGYEALGYEFEVSPELNSDGVVMLEWLVLMTCTGAALWAHGFATRAMRDNLAEANNALRTEVVERTDAEQRAVKAAAARTTFVATISHEIRTPLNGVLGVTELLLDTELDAEQRELAETARRSSSLLHALLDDVLDFSKIDAGALELEKVPLDLRALCEDVVRMWRTPVEERSLAFVFAPTSNAPRWVLADPTRLRQILGNLINNAMKFTETGYVKVILSRDGDDAVLAVQDTGIGIDDQAIQTIFAPFKQADNSTTRSYGGSGLGLAICGELAAAMGGTLTVTSKLGVGSVFTLQAPLPTAKAPPVSLSVVLDDKRLAGQRVLVAEDNPVNVMVTTRLLTRIGVEVIVAGNGRECIDAWREHAPTLILMDCSMPICDGYQATAAIRDLGGKLPIIALTANSGADERRRCLESGMDGHLTKPVQATQLEAVLSHWLLERQSINNTDVGPAVSALVQGWDASKSGLLHIDAATGAASLAEESQLRRARDRHTTESRELRRKAKTAPLPRGMVARATATTLPVPLELVVGSDQAS